jgi:hypothetical protein
MFTLSNSEFTIFKIYKRFSFALSFYSLSMQGVLRKLQIKKFVLSYFVS